MAEAGNLLQAFLGNSGTLLDLGTQVLMNLSEPLQQNQNLTGDQLSQLRTMFRNALSSFFNSRGGANLPSQLSSILALLCPEDDVTAMFDNSMNALRAMGYNFPEKDPMFIDRKEYYGDQKDDNDEEIDVLLMSIGVQLDGCDLPSNIKPMLLEALHSSPKCPITLDELVIDDFLISDVKTLIQKVNDDFHCHLYRGSALDKWFRISVSNPTTRQSVAYNQVFTLTKQELHDTLD